MNIPLRLVITAPTTNMMHANIPTRDINKTVKNNPEKFPLMVNKII